jgi:hypothetical protein
VLFLKSYPVRSISAMSIQQWSSTGRFRNLGNFHLGFPLLSGDFRALHLQLGESYCCDFGGLGLDCVHVSWAGILHMATPHCKGGWEIPSNCVLKKGRKWNWWTSSLFLPELIFCFLFIFFSVRHRKTLLPQEASALILSHQWF